jgi:hypothetical protein
LAAWAITAVVDQVVAVGGECRVALEAGGGEVAQAAAVGVHDRDAVMALGADPQGDPAAVGGPVGGEGVVVEVGELSQAAAVGLDGVELEAGAGVGGEHDQPVRARRGRDGCRSTEGHQPEQAHGGDGHEHDQSPHGDHPPLAATPLWGASVTTLCAMTCGVNR